MKILLCGFDDLVGGAGKLHVMSIRLGHTPFDEASIGRADVVAVIASGRALVLKDIRGRWEGQAIPASHILGLIESEAFR